MMHHVIQGVEALWQISIMSKKKKVKIVAETPTIHKAISIKHCLIVHYGLRCVKKGWASPITEQPNPGILGVPREFQD